MDSQLEIFLEVLQRTSIIYFGVLAGFIFIKSFFAKFRPQFISLTISVITPILIFVSILRISIDINWIYPVMGALFATIIGIVTPKLIARISLTEKPDSAELCTAAFPNALNFPFPIIFAFAPDALGAAGIFLATTLVLRNTIGLYISGVSLKRKDIKELLLFPPIWAIIFAFLLKPAVSPDNAFLQSTPVDFVFLVGIFMTVMTVGFSLQRPDFKYRIPMLRVAVSRFFISGLIVVFFILTFPIPEIIAIALVVQMISPPAVFNSLYAEKFGLNTELTTQIIVSLTLLALIALPFELMILVSVFDL